MNAPLPEHIRKALETVTLDDKYSLDYGRAFMSGVQALVRLPMLQRAARCAGRPEHRRLHQRLPRLAARRLRPGAVEGREAPHGPEHRVPARRQRGAGGHRGVGHAAAGLHPRRRTSSTACSASGTARARAWTACSDVFKHANMAGTAPHGGVIAVAGDDHVAKSSTAAHQSDHIFKACGLPVFFPSSVQDILDLGLHAFAMSRYAGVWAGMKTIQEIVESSATAMIDPDRVDIVHARRLRDAARRRAHPLARPRAGAGSAADGLQVVRGARLHARQPPQPQRDRGAERPLRHHRQRQGLQRHPPGAARPGPGRRRPAASSASACTRSTWCGRWRPRSRATSPRACSEILVVEEKRQVIEYQLKEELYNWRPDVRPNVLGKFDEAEGDKSGGEWSQPNPTANTAAARQGRPDAGDDRPGDRASA